jgi:hypothetical protein
VQNVPAKVDDVTAFLKRLITTTETTGRDVALNERVTEATLQSVAQTICSEFAGNIRPWYACYRVVLTLPHDLEDCSSIPLEATVEGSERTLEIFGRTEGTTTWGELTESHRDERQRWLAELDASFEAACSGRLAALATQTFRAHDGVRIFRPELYRLDRKGDTPVMAVVVFTEEVTPAKVGGPVFNRLRIGERLEAEVFQPLRRIGESATWSELEDLFHAFGLVREEATMHNVFDDSTSRTSFPDADMQTALGDVVRQWEEEVRRLEDAQPGRDEAEARGAFEVLNRLNDRYRSVVAQRYAELLALD